MGRVAEILLCYVRSVQKDWMEIGWYDDGTVRIREGIKGKNCKKMCSSQKADETAYKVSAPPDTPIYVGEWRGVRFFVGCNIKVLILQNGIENWQCPAEATGTAFIAPSVALTDIAPCRSDMLAPFGRMVL